MAPSPQQLAVAPEQLLYYIATRGNEKGIERARKVRDALNALGYVWTFDWTIDMEANFAAGKRDTDLTLAEKTRYAASDLAAVKRAHVTIYLEDEKSEGSAGELCLALAFNRVLVVVAPGIPRCLFATLAAHFSGTDEDAVAWVHAHADVIVGKIDVTP